MKLQIMQFKCAKCGDYFKAADLSFESYGEFLLRTLDGEGEAYLNAFEDKTYDEVSLILDKNLWMNEQVSLESVDVLKKIYGFAACDPAESGEPFRMGLFPKCPYCHSREMASWDEACPVEFVEKYIPKITHLHWNLFSENQKIEAVEKAVRLFYNN